MSEIIKTLSVTIDNLSIGAITGLPIYTKSETLGISASVDLDVVSAKIYFGKDDNYLNNNFIECEINGSGEINDSVELTLGDGLYKIVLEVYDDVGNSGTSSKEIVLDTSPPVIGSFGVENNNGKTDDNKYIISNSDTNNINVVASFSDTTISSGVNYKFWLSTQDEESIAWSETTNTIATGSLNINGLVDGDYKVYFKIRDFAENIEVAELDLFISKVVSGIDISNIVIESSNYRVIKPDTEITIDFTTTQSDKIVKAELLLYNDGVLVNTITPGGADLTILSDGLTSVDVVLSGLWIVTDGNYLLMIKITDEIGREILSNSEMLIVDSSAPVIIVEELESPLISSKMLTGTARKNFNVIVDEINYIDLDEVPEVEVRIDGVLATAYNPQLIQYTDEDSNDVPNKYYAAISFDVEEGVKIYNFSIKDRAGNIGTISYTLEYKTIDVSINIKEGTENFIYDDEEFYSELNRMRVRTASNICSFDIEIIDDWEVNAEAKTKKVNYLIEGTELETTVTNGVANISIPNLVAEQEYVMDVYAYDENVPKKKTNVIKMSFLYDSEMMAILPSEVYTITTTGNLNIISDDYVSITATPQSGSEAATVSLEKNELNINQWDISIEVPDTTELKTDYLIDFTITDPKGLKTEIVKTLTFSKYSTNIDFNIILKDNYNDSLITTPITTDKYKVVINSTDYENIEKIYVDYDAQYTMEQVKSLVDGWASLDASTLEISDINTKSFVMEGDVSATIFVKIANVDVCLPFPYSYKLDRTPLNVSLTGINNNTVIGSNRKLDITVTPSTVTTLDVIKKAAIYVDDVQTKELVFPEGSYASEVTFIANEYGEGEAEINDDYHLYIPEEGVHSIKIKVTDPVDRTSFSETVNIKIDNTAPITIINGLNSKNVFYDWAEVLNANLKMSVTSENAGDLRTSAYIYKKRYYDDDWEVVETETPPKNLIFENTIPGSETNISLVLLDNAYDDGVYGLYFETANLSTGNVGETGEYQIELFSQNPKFEIISDFLRPQSYVSEEEKNISVVLKIKDNILGINYPTIEKTVNNVTLTISTVNYSNNDNIVDETILTSGRSIIKYKATNSVGSETVLYVNNGVQFILDSCSPEILFDFISNENGTSFDFLDGIYFKGRIGAPIIYIKTKIKDFLNLEKTILGEIKEINLEIERASGNEVYSLRKESDSYYLYHIDKDNVETGLGDINA